MLTPNVHSARSQHSSGRRSTSPYEQLPTSSLPLPTPPPIDTTGNADAQHGEGDGPRSTVMRPSPRISPLASTPYATAQNGLGLPPLSAGNMSASPGAANLSPLPTPHSRRQSRVIISEDPGGISLRRVSVDHHSHNHHLAAANADTTSSAAARRSAPTAPSSRRASHTGLPPRSEDGSDHPERSPLPAPIGAAYEANGGGNGAGNLSLMMESMRMTPENPHVIPSFGEEEYNPRGGGGPAHSGSMVLRSGTFRRNDSRMTMGATALSSGEAGGGYSGAFGAEYGDDARSDDEGSEDGEIRENTFAFIAVENDRLERERVIAIIDPTFLTWRHRWFCILEGRPHDQDEFLAFAFNMLSISFVLASCVIFCLQSLPENTNIVSERGTDPYFLAETTCVVFFVLEAAWRVLCVPMSHLFTGFFAIDIITIVGYFADLFGDANVLSSVSQAMRLLRVFRVFKLSRYSTSLQMVFGVLRNSFSGLSMLVMPLALVTVIFSASIYLAEIWDATFQEDTRVWLQPSGFPSTIQSMPDAIWFTFATITTVGYGDVVPQTTAGKILAVLLMFVGVLTLSFPNIVLGANLQVAFKQSKQGHGVAIYTRKIRKVGHIVAFIRRTQYWVAVRKARQAAKMQQVLQHTDTLSGLSAQGRELAIRANYAFFPTHADFEAHRKPGVEPVRPSNLRHWTLRGVDPIHVLQTLLEVYSGVATAAEIYEEMIAGGMSSETRLKDVALTLLYLSEARIVRAFILERNTTHLVAALMEPAVSELLLHAERSDRQCKRSAEYARFVWKQTTGQLVPYTLSLLFNTYTLWSRRERYAEDDSIADLRLTIQMPADVRKLLLDEEENDPMASSGNNHSPLITLANTNSSMASFPASGGLGRTAIGAKKRTTRGDALAASIGAGGQTPTRKGPPLPADLVRGLALLHESIKDAQASIRTLEAGFATTEEGGEVTGRSAPLHGTNPAAPRGA